MDDTPISRGFKSRRGNLPQNRVPPGQHVTPDFPVLTYGPAPQISTKDWTLALQFGGRLLAKWSWAEFEALPQTTIKTDIHCVTTWSKLDTTWSGVTFDDLLAAAGLAGPPSPFVMAHCDGAYTTNVPAADLLGGRGMIATHYEGSSDLIGSWRPGPAACAASLFLEKRQVGPAPALPGEGRTRLLGKPRLSHVWRSLAGTAL